jgi:hypothetical protein
MIAIFVIWCRRCVHKQRDEERRREKRKLHKRFVAAGWSDECSSSAGGGR